ncbi:MAG TPA: response regulator [Candidatus Binatia bacterium]
MQEQSSPKILVVDDHEELRQLMAIYLGHCGYNVLESANGRTAISTAIAADPKFILLDLRLPDMSGLEVARALRNMAQTKRTPIVGWTAYPFSAQEKKRLLRAGFIDCLLKPVDPRMLESLIEQFVPKPQF